MNVQQDKYSQKPKQSISHPPEREQVEVEQEDATNEPEDDEFEEIEEPSDSMEGNKWSWDDDANHALNELWYGRASSSSASLVDTGRNVLHAVLCLCLGDLDWVRNYLEGFRFKSFTIVSKCGVIPNLHELPEGVKVLQLKNVGRIDHTIAHWMLQLTMDNDLGTDSNPQDIIVFLKDNIIVHTDAIMRSLKAMLEIAEIEGFSCGLEPRVGKSFFHLTGMLATFYMDDYFDVLGRRNSPENDPYDVSFKSPFPNMGAWLRAMNISLPEPLSPVCYGGFFAVKRARIQEVQRQIWINLERSLSRGDNIEEGHFAERTWAGLLYRQLADHEKELLFSRTKGIAHLNEGMRGALMKG